MADTLEDRVDRNPWGLDDSPSEYVPIPAKNRLARSYSKKITPKLSQQNWFETTHVDSSGTGSDFGGPASGKVSQCWCRRHLPETYFQCHRNIEQASSGSPWENG
jgi:hypothetical protein